MENGEEEATIVRDREFDLVSKIIKAENESFRKRIDYLEMANKELATELDRLYIENNKERKRI